MKGKNENTQMKNEKSSNNLIINISKEKKDRKQCIAIQENFIMRPFLGHQR